MISNFAFFCGSCYNKKNDLNFQKYIMRPRCKKYKGFTLIELLIVIAIIILLAALILISLKGSQARARDTKRIADVDSLRKALELYYNDRGNYPLAKDWIKIEEDADTNGSFSQAMENYLLQMPRDPLYPRVENPGGENEKIFSYQYKSTADQKKYKIHIELETGEYASYEIYSPGGDKIVYDRKTDKDEGRGGIGVGGGLPACKNPSGYALKSVAGVDDKVLVSRSPSLNVTSGTGLTLEAWLKLDNLAGLHYIIDKCGPDKGGYCWAVLPHDPQTGKDCPTVQFGGDLQPGGMWLVWSKSCQTAPTIGEWTHLALTYSPDHHVVMYKNGVIVDQGKLGPQHKIYPSPTIDLAITGCYDVDFCKGIDGIIDEVRIYGKALPPDLIAAHCAGDFSKDSTGCDGGDCDLRAHWRFNEGSGNRAADASGKGNTGTLINNPQWVSVP